MAKKYFLLGKSYDNKDDIAKTISRFYDENDTQTSDNKFLNYLFALVMFAFFIFILSLILNISDKIRNYNNVAGVVSLVLLIALFLFFVIRPVFCVLGMDHFDIRVSKTNVKGLDLRNKKTRKNIANRIIKFKMQNPNSNWYDEQMVEDLKNAVDANDDNAIHDKLKILMEKSIKGTSNGIIVKSAVQAGLYTAMIPSQQLDAMLVAKVNFNMIKDIFFLYGFRPTKTKLFKIYLKSISASLTAYGLEGSGAGTFLARILTRLPFIPGVSSYVADMLAQAITNGTFTIFIGYSAIDYLKKEYKLQSLIKEVNVLDFDEGTVEFEETKKEVEKKLNKEIPKLKNFFGNRNKN